MSRPPPGNNSFAASQTRKWVLGGRVQGVGFRPFVYRVARRYGIDGWVRNLAGQVEIVAQGHEEVLASFGDSLIAESPPLARPEILSVARMRHQFVQGFDILESRASEPARVHVPPDYFACDECLAELRDQRDRRYRYPFINCTQCGPRYTLIQRLPYDRCNTTMADFRLCARCAAEYGNALDRRFHAEPVACPECGPRIEYCAADESVTGEAALAACIRALEAGKVVAVKGIGGYHLMCDAENLAAVATLRARKQRPHKPLAVMFPLDVGLAAVRRQADLTADHVTLLMNPMRPVVLVPKRRDTTLAPEIAPGCNEIGAMLPYSPLHHLLLDDFGKALVATSANVSGEPVLTDNIEVQTRLAHVADAFLHHNREIARPADDPVYRIIGDRPRPVRIGRGNSPLEFTLPHALPRPLLALGGQLKNTIAIGWDRRVVVSPHLGDMHAPRSIARLVQVANDLQALYGVTAEAVVCDAHPGYDTTRLAGRMGLPLTRVWHHYAHASALAGEYPYDGEWLVFTWDGVGLGADGTLWGGEALAGQPGHWQRVASLRQFALPGGERAAREPWRSAISLCWETGRDWANCRQDTALLRHAWQRSLNCQRTSSVGRLFDAAAALLGLITHASHEGQAPTYLEAACTDSGEAISLPLSRDDDGMWRTDWEPLLDPLQDATTSVNARAAMFHASLARALIDQALAVRAGRNITRLGLTGGVFQNRVLCERVMELARSEGFTVFVPEQLPCNDAGISFGQLVEASAPS